MVGCGRGNISLAHHLFKANTSTVQQLINMIDSTSNITLNESLMTMGDRESEAQGENADQGWKPDRASDYDYCMVFAVDKQTNGLPKVGNNFCNKMAKAGLDLYLFYSIRKTHIFVLIRASVENLRIFADGIEFPMLLDAEKLKEAAERGDAEAGIAPIDITHDPEVTPLLPHECIYAKYRTEIPEELYWRPEGMTHPFRESVRLKLIQSMIEAKPKDGSHNIKIRYHILKKKIAAFFPLHNRRELDELKSKWLTPKMLPWKQPIYDIKEYFGEKIGLYFTFMAHYTAWLSIPSIVGIPLQIYVLAANDFSNPALPFFSFFVAVWAIVMLEFWKRREKMTAMRWGMIGYEDNELNRPEFRGATIKSFINGREIIHFPTKKRAELMLQSFIIIGVMIAVVVGAVVSIYIMRHALSYSIGSAAQTVTSIVNAVQIQIFNAIYSLLADALTERENHRTDTAFEDSMIAKLFLFQFVNSYASFFYIAFIASSQPPSGDAQDDYQGDCGAVNCMIPLAVNLAIIFGTRVTVGNLTELLVPYLLFLRKYQQETLFAQAELLRPEREFMLQQYNVIKSSLNDYAELAVQFGYVALFISALPIAGFAAFVSNIFEIRGDAWKLMLIYQRPVPKGAEDIGTWQSIFTLMSVAAVITNAALTVFTMDVLDDYSDKTRCWIFILFQWICFAIQAIAMALVPDEPEEVAIQKSRSDFLAEKVVMRIPDEELAAIESQISEKIVFTVNDYSDAANMNPMQVE